jgi:hypothetical protein
MLARDAKPLPSKDELMKKAEDLRKMDEKK